MKKLLLILSVVALIGASSCNKAYTCTCSTTGSTGGYAVTNESIPSTTKSTAQSDCTAWQTSMQAAVTGAGGTGTVSCGI